MLDTKWPEIRIKNKKEICVKPRNKLYIKFSDIEIDNEEDIIYINFSEFENIPKDSIISIDDNKIILQTKKVAQDYLEVIPIVCWTINPWKSLTFRNFTPNLDFLTEEDKAYIKWWIDNNISLILNMLEIF